MKRAWLFALITPTICLAAEAPIAPTTPKLATGIGWLQWGLALLLVLAALMAFLWLLRRLSGASGLGTRHLRILGGVSLGVRERVVLLQAGNKQLVLGVSPGRIQTLCVLEGEDKVPVDTPAGPPDSGAFARQLNHLMTRKETTA